MAATVVLNLLWPGAGLVIRDRLVVGLLLVVMALLLVSLAVALWLLATPAFLARALPWLGGGYLASMAMAAALWWWLEREGAADQALLRVAHDDAASALLRGDSPRALLAARRLVRIAPRHPGAWRLLGLAAEAAGSSPDRRRAEHRLRVLVRQAG